MYIYIAFFLIIVFFTKKNELFNSSIYFVLTIFIFHAFRYNVGYDYPEYYKIFNELPVYHRSILRLEPLNRLLIQFIKTINIWWLGFTTYSFVTIYFTVKAYKKNTNWKYVYLFFISLPSYYLLSMSLVRQFAAVGLVFYAYSISTDKKYFLSTVLILLASLIHFPAIVTLGGLFLTRISWNRKRIFLFGMSSFLFISFFYVFLINFLGYARYINLLSFKYEGGNSILLLYSVFISLAIFKYKYLSTSSKTFLPALVLGLSLFYFLHQFGQIGQRIFIYFSYALPFIFYDIFKIYFKNHHKITIYIFCLIIFIFTIISSNELEVHPYIPYETIF